MNQNHKEFNRYLIKSGVFDALTDAFAKLFMMKEDDLPENSVWFMQQQLMKNLPDDFPSFVEYQKLVHDLKGAQMELSSKMESGELDRTKGAKAGGLLKMLADTATAVSTAVVENATAVVENATAVVENATAVVENANTDVDSKAPGDPDATP